MASATGTTSAPNPLARRSLRPGASLPPPLFYYDLTILAQTARLLGSTNEADEYEQRATAVKQAFNQAYYNPKNGSVWHR